MITRCQYGFCVTIITRWHHCIGVEIVTGWVHWIVNAAKNFGLQEESTNISKQQGKTTN